MDRMRVVWARVIFFGCLLALSLSVGGCRQAERIAWAADARGLGALGSPAQAVRQSTGLAQYLAGVLAENRGELAQAKAYYRSARESDPASAQVLLHLGMASLRGEDVPEALRWLEAASRMEPKDPRARFLLGVLYTDQGRYEEAAQQYSRILSDEPENLGALTHLADLYVMQEKLQEGLAVYHQLLKERPDSSVAHFNIGVLYAKAGDWPAAVEHLSKAMELDPAFLEARLGLAVALEMAGRLEEARRQFMEALEREPNNTQLIHYLARMSYRLGDPEEAAQWLTRYLSFKPREAAAHLELAYLRIAQGRWQEAAQQIQSILDPQSPSAESSALWTALGFAYQNGARYAAAEEAYLQAIAAGPEELEPRLQLASMHQRQQQYEKAEGLLHEAFRRHPDDARLLNALGYLYADWGTNLPEAVALLERAVSQEPENGAYLDSLGWAYFRLGRTEEARQLLEEAVRRLPDPEVFDHLGQVYLHLEKLDDAVSAWEKGLEHSSNDPQMADRLKSRLKQIKRRGR